MWVLTSWSVGRFGGSGKVVHKPVPGQSGDGFECTRLFEQVCCAWDDGKMIVAPQEGLRFPVETNHGVVVAAHDEKGRRSHRPQMGSGEIGASAARDDGAYLGSRLSRGP